MPSVAIGGIETNLLYGKVGILLRWFQGTTDAIGAQFFLKNVHSEMRSAAYELFGKPESLRSRPNIFGELMRVLISPSKDVEEAVNWVLDGVGEPDINYIAHADAYE
ncbi:hypothetical protein SLE2022_000750 [Rubroshorea leprosula]